MMGWGCYLGVHIFKLKKKNIWDTRAAVSQPHAMLDTHLTWVQQPFSRIRAFL